MTHRGRPRTLWNHDARTALRSRLGGLTPEARPRWGRMSPLQMITHLSQSVRLALGELTVVARPGPLRRFPLKQFVIYLLPFPKGTAAPRELLEGTPAGWSDSLLELDALTDRLVARADDPAHPWPDHPFFGRLSKKEWGVLGYRHMDHHLRQFDL